MRTRLVILTMAVLIAACPRAGSKTPSDPAEAAGQVAKISPDPDQKRLWEDASKRGAAVGLENIPVAEEPVQVQQKTAPANRVIEGKVGALPPGATSILRIVEGPDTQGQTFRGAAEVVRSEGEQLVLRLGEAGTLTLLARAGGRPLRARPQELARVEYRARHDPYNRIQVVALRMQNGDGIVSVLEGGPRPVTVQIPLFSLTANQVGNPRDGTMPVDVQVGRSRQRLAVGQIAEIEGLTVGILGSTAYVGADAPRAEGNPFAIDLIAWPSVPK